MSETVGVAIPTYQHEDFLRLTIRSVIEQTTLPNVIVVVDDFSDDGTVRVAEQFAEVELIRHERRLGPTRTTADAIAACRTDFVAVLDGDDTMRPHRIERQLATFAQDPALRVVGSLVQPIDSSGAILGKPCGIAGNSLTALDWARDGMLAGGSSLMVKAPLVNHDCRLTWASDWKFVLDNLYFGATSVVLDEVLVDYRRHGGSVSVLHRINGLSDHVLMCDLILEAGVPADVERELHRQRSMKQCQLGEAHLTARAYCRAGQSFGAALVESRGRLSRDVLASIRDGLKAGPR